MMRKTLVTLLGLWLIGASLGCAARQRHYTIAADYAFATAVNLASNTAFQECTVHAIPADTCNGPLRTTFIEIETGVKAVTIALRDMPADGAMPKSLPDLLRALNSFHASLDALGASTNPQLQRLVSLVSDAIDKVTQVLYIFTAVQGGN